MLENICKKIKIFPDCKIEDRQFQFPDCAYLRIRAPIPFIFQRFLTAGISTKGENEELKDNLACEWVHVNLCPIQYQGSSSPPHHHCWGSPWLGALPSPPLQAILINFHSFSIFETLFGPNSTAESFNVKGGHYLHGIDSLLQLAISLLFEKFGFWTPNFASAQHAWVGRLFLSLGAAGHIKHVASANGSGLCFRVDPDFTWKHTIWSQPYWTDSFENGHCPLNIW